ncbi:prolyl hydroxylase family protein [Candidatus Uabimicrobium sp. HlEnr_7]|uniref:prolyl hydroxylase family protein n=1 Tax=Candidatus Uabimicrobium helgolandensis TaxID=3095367 RepID=UPI0035570D90
MSKITDSQSYQKYVSFVKQNYQPLHTYLYNFDTKNLSKSFYEVIEKNTNPLDAVTEIYPQIYSWEIFTPEFCNQFIAEVRHFDKWCRKNSIEKRLPNSMNNYGVVLGDFGLYDCLNQLMIKYIKPITSIVYPEIGGATLDYHHSFTVEYAVEKDVSLDFHVDASDVTVNICLGNEFEGGDLYFGGIRCAFCQETSPKKAEEIYVRHQPGHAILHRGKHRHSAQDIKSGERLNMILWCMSSENQKTQLIECPDWCGSK